MRPLISRPLFVARSRVGVTCALCHSTVDDSVAPGIGRRLDGWANTTLDDIQQGLTDSLDRQGRGGMLAPFKFFDGSVTTPGASFTNETSTGFSRPTTGTIDVSSLADVMDVRDAP